MPSNEGIDPIKGIIKLNQKIEPVCNRHYSNEESLCVLTDIIDITKLKNKLLNLNSNYWEDEVQVNEGNVKLVRPAHDNWGIKKIPFTFCDDFLLKVIDLPFSQDKEWQILLNEIYLKAGIKNIEKQLVRSLLASMPPNMNIPVHHDTGFWVKYTHRVHVPIITNDNIDFLVGNDVNNMNKINFHEGHIIELNNQAKHSVINHNTKESNFWRVHLIFDYIDLPNDINNNNNNNNNNDYIPKFSRYILNSTDKLLQTRRTIDVIKYDNNKIPKTLSLYPVEWPKLPRFIILGVQKCGTTSLYEYLCQHPLVLRGLRRETHYFDWRYCQEINNSNNNNNNNVFDNNKLIKMQKHREHYMTNYYQIQYLNTYTDLITGESTPSYLLHSDIVIPRLLDLYGYNNNENNNKIESLEAPLKLLIMLRDPVDRAYSQYQMMQDTRGTEEQIRNRGQSAYSKLTFAEAVDLEIKNLNILLNNINNITIEQFQNDYLSLIQNITHGGHSLLLRGIYYFQIICWLQKFTLFSNYQLLKNVLPLTTKPEIMIITLDEISIDKNITIASDDGKRKIQNKMDEIFHFIGLREHVLDDISIKNKRDYTPEKNIQADTNNNNKIEMLPETRKKLSEFYRPFNEKLISYLLELYQTNDHPVINSIRKWQ